MTTIYERANGVTYARKFGAAPESRVEISRDSLKEDNIFGVPTKDLAIMIEIFQAAKHNPALQDALDRVIVIHQLSKQDDSR